MRVLQSNERTGIRGKTLLIAALAVALLSMGSTNARPDTDPSPGTCDGKDLVFHRHRARVLLKDAYAVEGKLPKHSAVQKAQAHKQCIRVAGVRKQIADLRDRLEERLRQQRHDARQSDWCSPTPVADGAGCWEIPAWCVEAESGGSWTADNPSSDARGPYQLLGHGEPWPVTTRAQAMEHHRIAADLYASSGLQPWVAC